MTFHLFVHFEVIKTSHCAVVSFPLFLVLMLFHTGDYLAPPSMCHHAVRRACQLGTHPLDVLAEGLAEAGAQDLEVHVRVGAAVLEVHDAGQTCDVALQETHT